MPDSGAQSPYQLAQGEKATPVMVYTQSLTAWGDMITKELVRVGTLLRSNMAPQYVSLFNAQAVFMGSASPRVFPFPELHIPTSQVIAFHLTGPVREPPDYESGEQNRKMEPVSALVGSFRFDGHLRMPTQVTLERFLDNAKEEFTSLYDVDITQLGQASSRPIRAAFTIVRRELVLFSPRIQ